MEILRSAITFSAYFEFEHHSHFWGFRTFYSTHFIQQGCLPLRAFLSALEGRGFGPGPSVQGTSLSKVFSGDPKKIGPEEKKIFEVIPKENIKKPGGSGLMPPPRLGREESGGSPHPLSNKGGCTPKTPPSSSTATTLGLH